ncbi:MAG: ABC transporter permease [Acidobacteriaceae bacterium]|nr:ABC transporter permease [Acidobacteriaceae bacterium]
MTWMQDIRYGIRQLRKAPGFTTTAILTLALGIGANASIFTLIHALLLKNLPVADPKTLLRIGDSLECCVNSGTNDKGNYSLFSNETWRLLKKDTPEFQELAAMQAGFSYQPVTARRERGHADARSVMGEFVSGNYFRTFGLRPQAGRLLSDGDDVEGAAVMGVMSYAMWQRDYAGDPSIIGSTFWINTKPVTIVGVAPAGFYGDRLSTTPPDFFLPIESMEALAGTAYVHDADVRWLYLVGRVKPGTPLKPLQEKLSALVRQSFAETKTFSKGEGKKLLAKTHVVLSPGGAGIQDLQEQYGSNLRVLMAISGLVLLIACANVANLLLARGMARKQEISLRTALGANRGQLIRQLLTESVLLALFSSIAGLAVSYAATSMLLGLAFGDAQRLPVDARPSLAVLMFACGLALLTGVLFGIAPAWITSRTNPVDALRTGMRSTGSGASLVQRGLVVLQAGLSLVLLTGAGLFTQSLSKLQHSNLRLESKDRYIIHINPQAAGYSQTQLELLYRTIEERFHAIPGVKNVGITIYTPMEDNNWGTGIQVKGQANPHAGASVVKVNSEYFDSVGTHVLMGRGISERDTLSAPVVAVVNQEFAKKFFPGQNPIGRYFGPSPESAGDYKIVGVVEDTTYTSVRWKQHRMYFLSILQRDPSDKEPIEKDLSLYAGALVVQTETRMNEMAGIAQRTLAAINPNLTVVKFQTFDQQIADRFTEERMVARLTTLFGALALLLATIGLYGVTAYTTASRTVEIGIRMALGAARTGVVGMVMRGAMIQTVLGLAIGIPTSVLCVRFIESQLFDMKGVNIGVLVTAILTLSIAASLAGAIPARRAASIDPARALRTE